MSEQKQIDNAVIRALQEYNSGAAISEASEALRRASIEVQRLGKSAVVSIDLKIELTGGNALVMSAEVSSKLPKPEPFRSIVYADDRGNLFRNNPTQPEMELKTVEADQPAQELKKVS